MSKSPAHVADSAGALALLAAIVLQALNDAAHGDAAARDWLDGGGCDQLLDRCGLNLTASEMLTPGADRKSSRSARVA